MTATSEMPPIDKAIMQLDALHFEVTRLNIDHGQFQKMILACWPTIRQALEREAERRKRLSVVKG